MSARGTSTEPTEADIRAGEFLWLLAEGVADPIAVWNGRAARRVRAAEQQLLAWFALLAAGYLGAFGWIGAPIAVAIFGMQWTFYRINVIRAEGRNP